jgi:hypothetical protein
MDRKGKERTQGLDFYITTTVIAGGRVGTTRLEPRLQIAHAAAFSCKFVVAIKSATYHLKIHTVSASSSTCFVITY